MAPNNALANTRAIDNEEEKSGRTTILKSGTVEARGMGTNINSREVISDQIQQFLRGEGRFTPKAEFRGFFTVWTFVTRLPGPTWVDHHPGYLMRGMAYFPLSGSLIGIFVSVFYDLADVTMGLPSTISSVISESASLWMTGCFHEDGLADSADGIGGGWTRDQILKIMTDTRLGTYGCAVLLLYIVAKLELLATLGSSNWALGNCEGAGPAIIVSHTLARLTSPLLIKTNDYVDEQGPKYQFYSFMIEAKHLVTWHRVFFAMFTSFIVAALAYGSIKATGLILAVLIAVIFSGRYADYLLAGVMGDYLGATICVTEVYLLVIILLFPLLEGHAKLLQEFADIGLQSFQGSITFHSLMDALCSDERKVALLKFASVGIFTIIWCSCVGHPPVFVRESVRAKGKTREIQIALDSKNKDMKEQCNNKSSLGTALCDPKKNFAARYDAARNYIDSLAKPVGSLGTMEDWAARLAALQGTNKPDVSKVACLIFAADHGVAKDKKDGGENCSAYPQAVTQKVLEALEYKMAGASVLAATNNIYLRVIDIGLANDVVFGSGNVVVSSKNKVFGGTQNFCCSSAMTDEEINGCIAAGRQEVKMCIEKLSPNVLIFGEVGIGNTTASSALLAALTAEPVAAICGSGATKTRDGVDDSIVAEKVAIVTKAIEFHGSSNMSGNPIIAMKNVGGAEIAAIVGGILEASENNTSVLVDGFIVTVAAMIACQISPSVSRILLLATKSTEKGQWVAINKIQEISKDNSFPPLAKPALDMDLRMGEGTGALTAVPILKSAAAMISNLATLDDVLNIKMESVLC